MRVIYFDKTGDSCDTIICKLRAIRIASSESNTTKARLLVIDPRGHVSSVEISVDMPQALMAASCEIVDLRKAQEFAWRNDQ